MLVNYVGETNHKWYYKEDMVALDDGSVDNSLMVAGGGCVKQGKGVSGLDEHLQTALVEANSPLPPQALRPYCGQLSEFQQKIILLVFAHSRRTQR